MLAFHSTSVKSSKYEGKDNRLSTVRGLGATQGEMSSGQVLSKERGVENWAEPVFTVVSGQSDLEWSSYLRIASSHPGCTQAVLGEVFKNTEPRQEGILGCSSEEHNPTLPNREDN